MGLEKFSPVNKANKLPEEYIDINDENIIMEFALDNNNYCVLGNFRNSADIIYFAKIDINENGEEVIKGIDGEEYNKVVNYYEKLLEDMEDYYEEG